MIQTVTVYCASSEKSPGLYLEAATRLGRAGGKVVGVLPRFMDELEWGHRSLTELRVVDSMHERKQLMLELADAVVALPGGCGTLEELFEAITWKRLGLYFGPIVLVNVNGFFDSCTEMLSRCVDERFMDERHRAMWSVVTEPEAVVEAIHAAPAWTAAARSFAQVK